jgi:hypothetical protein
MHCGWRGGSAIWEVAFHMVVDKYAVPAIINTDHTQINKAITADLRGSRVHEEIPDAVAFLCKRMRSVGCCYFRSTSDTLLITGVQPTSQRLPFFYHHLLFMATPTDPTLLSSVHGPFNNTFSQMFGRQFVVFNSGVWELDVLRVQEALMTYLKSQVALGCAGISF